MDIKNHPAFLAMEADPEYVATHRAPAFRNATAAETGAALGLSGPATIDGLVMLIPPTPKATPWDTGRCVYCDFTGNEHSSAQRDTCIERFGLEAAYDVAQAAHEAGEARLKALETAWKALNALDESEADLAEEDKDTLANLNTSAAWLALHARVGVAKTEVSRLDDVAYEAHDAVRAWEADHPGSVST